MIKRLLIAAMIIATPLYVVSCVQAAFLKYLRLAKVTLQEYEFPASKIANIGSQTTMLIEKNYYLNKSAREA